MHQPPTRTSQRVAARIADGQTVRIVMYGDSISEVQTRWFGGASEQSKMWGSELRDRLAEAYPDAKFEVTFFGVGGQNTYEGLGRIGYFDELDADLTIVAFGTNDCYWHPLLPKQTARALGELVKRIGETSDAVIVSTAGNNPSDERFKHVAETVAAQHSVANALKVPFVDMRRTMLDVTGDGERWGEYNLAQENAHPNDKGHAVWAAATFEVVHAAIEAAKVKAE